MEKVNENNTEAILWFTLLFIISKVIESKMGRIQLQ